MSDWLVNLKAGDEVGVSPPIDPVYITKVERVTGTMIVLESGRRFRRSDGKLIGTGGFRSIDLVEVTQKLRDSILHLKLARLLSKHGWSNLSLPTLEKVVKMLKDSKNGE